MKESDFNPYDINQSLIEDCHYNWLHCHTSEAAYSIGELHQLCLAGLSINPSYQKRSKSQTYHWLSYTSRALSGFALELARIELGLSPDEASSLFSQRSSSNESP